MPFMIVRTASASLVIATRKHSENPRPRGMICSDSRQCAKARGNVARSASRAARSCATGLSRIISNTSAPVSTNARIRDELRVRPTLRTPCAGQYTA